MRVGLPRMHQEKGERRDFLPSFVDALCRDGASEILIEDGYGAGMGLDLDDYLAIDPRVRVADHRDCYRQDVVAILRCPSHETLSWLTPGAILVSMLHFPTRPNRVDLLTDLDVRAVSLESVKDDGGRRLVENLRAVGWNGVEAAFREIARVHPNFSHPSRRPLRVTCLGAGQVGGHAVHAATRYGDPDLRAELVARNVPGVEVTVVDFDLTGHEDYMLGRLEQTDLLIDATQRIDPSSPVVPNRWLAALPEDAVLLDLASDPYVDDLEPHLIKGIEGVPQGDLDQWVFPVDDPAWERLGPWVDTSNRRTALSCYAWPGIHPRECMEVYGAQIEPLMTLVLEVPMDLWDEHDGSHVERAAARGELSRWKGARIR